MTKRFKQKLNSVFSITNIILMTLQSFMPGFFLLLPSNAYAEEILVAEETTVEVVEQEVEEVIVEETSTEYSLPEPEAQVVEQKIEEVTAQEELTTEVLELEEATLTNESIIEVETTATDEANVVEPKPEVEETTEDVLEPVAGPAPVVVLAEEVEETATVEVLVVEEKSIWIIDGKVATVEIVELGATYNAPQNGEVQVTFTKLPENPGSLKIEEIELSDEVVKQVGAYSNIAYDITSDMVDGTFEYELKLPVPEGADENIGLVYAESVEELTKATAIEDEVVEDGKVVAAGLDHFTVFVVADPTGVTNGVACTVASISGICYDDLQLAVDAAVSGDIIELASDITLTHRVDISTTLTLDGNGNTIYASFAKTSNSNNAALGIFGDNIVIKNLILDGTGGLVWPSQLHGINTYIASNVSLNDVSAMNFGGSGVVVNGSSVVVNNIKTAGNAWHGINVAQGSGVVEQSALTVNGNSEHSDLLHIYMDDTTQDVVLVDTLGQYSISNPQLSGRVNDRLYTHKDIISPLQPTGMRILNETGTDLSCEGYTDNRTITIDWADNIESDFDHYDYRIREGNIIKHPTVSELTGNIRDEDGYYKYGVRAVDTSGNVSEWSYWCGVTLDREATDAPELITPPNNSRVKGAVLLSDWTTVDGAVKYIYESYHDSAANNLRWHAEYTQSEKTANNVDESIFWWRVKAVDAAGNESAWSDLWKVTIDNTAPEVTILTPLSGNVKAGTFTAQATIIDAGSLSNVRVRFNHPVTNAIVKTYIMTNTLGDLWEYSVDSKADLPDGDYRMRVIATDEAGNKRNVSETPIVIDNSGPIATFITPKAGDFVSKDFKVEGTASDPHGVGRITLRFFEIDGAGKSIWPPVKEYDALPNYDGSLNWYYDVPKADLPDGEYIMRAVVADTISGSNKTIISENFIIVDNTKPTVLVTQPILDQQVAGVVSIAGTAEDQGSGIDKVALHIYRLNEDTTKTLVPGCTTLPGTVLGNDWSLFVNNGGSCNLTDGPYEIAAWAYDGAGNPGWAPRTQFYVDNTLPITTLTSPTDGDNTNKDILIEGSSTDVGIVDHVNLYYRVTGDTTWTLITALNNTGSDEPFSFSHSWTPPSDDSYDFKASGVDTAGNEENSAYVYEIIYDTVVPVVTWSNPTDTELLNGEVDLTAICDGGDTESTYVNFWWWKASEGQTVIDARDGSPKQYNRVGRTSLNGGTLTGNTFGFSLNTQDENIIQSSYNWDGEWKLRAACKDAAGNYAHSEINMNVDNTVNTPTITAPTTGDFFNTFTIRAEWNEVIDVNGIDKYEIQYDYLVNGVPTTAYREVAGTQLYRDQSLSGNVQGEFTIMLRAYDNLGNISAWSTPVSYVFDSLDPESKITTFDLEDEGETKTATFSGLIKGTATDKPIDLASGVAEVLLEIMHTPFGATQSAYWNGSDWQTPMATVSATGTTEWEYQIEPEEKVLEGTYVVTSHAVDNAGNIEETYTITIVYDKTIPEVTLTIDPTDPNGRNGWYVTEPTVTLTASDNYNVDYIEYQWNSTVGTWATYTAPINPPGEGQNVLYYRSVDLVGNISDLGVKEVKFDKTEPTDGAGNLQVKNIKSTTADATWNEPANADDISRFVLVWKHEDGSSRSKSVDGDVYETDLYDLFDGEWELTLESQDDAGNSYSVTEKFTVGGSSGDVLGTTDDTTSSIGGLVTGVTNFVTGDFNNEGEAKESDSEASTKTEEESGTVLGDSDATCATWKYYLPLFLLLIQLMFAVSLEIANKEPGKKKLLLALAISALAITTFYILKNADCYSGTGIIQTLSKWFVPASLVLAVILRWIGSMTVEEK